MKLKAMREKRAGLISDMEKITNKAQEETRALTDEEIKAFELLKSQIKSLDETIGALEEMEIFKNKTPDSGDPNAETNEQKEERAFKDYITGKVTEERAGEMTFNDNGAVIPKTILDKIITKVYDICYIYKDATRYNVKGNLVIPVYASDGNSITMAFANEFEELTSSKGTFTTIELKGYLAGALCKVSKSLINNSQFDIVSFVIEQMAISVALFIEKILIKGDPGKVDGLSGVELKVDAKSQTTVTIDELVQLKDKVKSQFQKDAYWIMTPTSLTNIRLLKDGNGRFLLEETVNGPVLLGKPVKTSEQMDEMSAGKTAIYYGDMKGLAVKVVEDETSIEVLQEKFATEHAIGVVAWVELDAKVQNKQAISKLVMKA